jgi:hypothetical protein
MTDHPAAGLAGAAELSTTIPAVWSRLRRSTRRLSETAIEAGNDA